MYKREQRGELERKKEGKGSGALDIRNVSEV